MSSKRKRSKVIGRYYGVAVNDTAIQTLPVLWVKKNAQDLARELTKASGITFEVAEYAVYCDGDVLK